MDFEELSKFIFSEMVPKLESNQGLSIFARERAKFEGWLKVELCGSLSMHVQDVVPEQDRIDITFNGWAIQLKTINTNVRYDGVKKKQRPITKNVQGIIEDINKLKPLNYANKAVLFVVFAITHHNPNWQVQLQRILALFKEIKFKELQFRGGVPGVIYFGSI